MRMPAPRPAFVLPLLLLLAAPHARADDVKAAATPPTQRGLAWLAAHQATDGSWGRRHTVAVTGLSCLALLAGSDDPFAGETGQALTKGLAWMLTSQQADAGMFPHQGHTWIHGQGFATLALAEAYGRARRGGTQPDLDLDAMFGAVGAAAKRITDNQSSSGGWWYTPGSPGRHEGSTTVCAVQALVAASNMGVEIDRAALDRGFEYLKRCQNPDGGFDYQEGPGTTSMKEGTAGDVATLALMHRFDYEVMTRGVDFLEGIGTQTISGERFPYYGHFYASMGLLLFGEEMGAEPQAKAWFDGAQKDILSWQQEDGSWPLKGWMVASSGEDGAYSTAFATLILEIPQRRLSVFHRDPPALPGPKVVNSTAEGD